MSIKTLIISALIMPCFQANELSSDPCFSEKKLESGYLLSRSEMKVSLSGEHMAPGSSRSISTVIPDRSQLRELKFIGRNHSLPVITEADLYMDNLLGQFDAEDVRDFQFRYEFDLY